jgi:hypothetical protein
VPVVPRGDDAGIVEPSANTDNGELQDDSRTFEWDGTEDLQVHDPHADLADAVEVVDLGAEATAGEVAQPTEDVIDRDYAVAGEIELDDGEAAALAGPGASHLFEVNGQRFDEVFEQTSSEYIRPFNDPAMEDDSAYEEDDRTGSLEEEAVLSDLEGANVSDGSPKEAPDEDPALAVHAAQAGFFAQLWGALRGRAGTDRRSDEAAVPPEREKASSRRH